MTSRCTRRGPCPDGRERRGQVDGHQGAQRRVPHNRGEVMLGGSPISIANPAASQAAGIATVFQDIHLGPKLNVVENVMLGHEVRGRFGINWAATRERAAGILASLGLDDLNLKVRLDTLKPAAQQLVAIARAMVDNPACCSSTNRPRVWPRPMCSGSSGSSGASGSVVSRSCSCPTSSSRPSRSATG
nr:ATP-binding cassette domain-containing protein [Tessaracoccus coleopterorum]